MDNSNVEVATPPAVPGWNPVFMAEVRWVFDGWGGPGSE